MKRDWWREEVEKFECFLKLAMQFDLDSIEVLIEV